VVRARINHVSISARELAQSVGFYTELFGAEVIESPNFGYPVQWLRIGDLQLHIFERTGDAPMYHHFALEVDDFERVCRETRARGLHDQQANGRHLNQLPSGQIQLYLRDPAGNLVEINCASADALSEETRSELAFLAERFPQDENNSRAHLDLIWSGRAPASAKPSPPPDAVTPRDS
jgi:catechol 2,3-dioxygenase-like lactoylglutathione lyase family enzyme